jgi:selenocysteine lyase/cysteine desulfurase
MYSGLRLDQPISKATIRPGTEEAGISLKAGDEIVIWEQNHPTNHVAWAVRVERYGVVVRTVSVPAQPTSIDELIAPSRKPSAKEPGFSP